MRSLAPFVLAVGFALAIPGCSKKSATKEWCAKAADHRIELQKALYQSICKNMGDDYDKMMIENMKTETDKFRLDCEDNGKYDPKISDCFFAAKSADEVRAVWRKYYLTIGHRKLGRLLLGRTAEQLLAGREKD